MRLGLDVRVTGYWINPKFFSKSNFFIGKVV